MALNYAIVTLESNIDTGNGFEWQSMTTAGWLDWASQPGQLVIWGSANPQPEDKGLCLKPELVKAISVVSVGLSGQISEG